MRLTFTLDDVIRAKTIQFGKMYKKYIDPSLELETIDFSSGNLEKIFGFKNRKEFEKFLYTDYAFEVFGEASPCDKQLSEKMNLWFISLQDEEEYEDLEISLSNPYEFNNSIGFSYFFLSKFATRIRNVFFPADSGDIWLRSDVVVTADPKLLTHENKGDKISVKIQTDYNKDVPSDFTYKSLLELLEDKEFLNKIYKKIKEEK